jgi:predicted nucleic acid-binding protein
LVLVDSSVWIAYFSPAVSEVEQKLETLIRPTNQAIITGIIFQEVLQGIRNPRTYQLTQKLLRRLPFLMPNAETHSKAAAIFRELASKGKSCASIDVLIAALAIENRIPFFTLDADFDFVAKYSNLKLFK